MAEPAAADLNESLFANDMVTHAAEPLPEAYAGLIPVEANALQPTKRKRAIPFFILPLFGFGGSGGGGSAPHPPPPLAVTPEPGTMLLLSSGLVGVYWKARKSRRKQ